MSEINKMTEKELKLLAVQKKKNGCYTSRALAAQRKLWEESHYPTNYLEEYKNGSYDNGYEVIDILSLQY